MKRTIIAAIVGLSIAAAGVVHAGGHHWIGPNGEATVLEAGAGCAKIRAVKHGDKVISVSCTRRIGG